MAAVSMLGVMPWTAADDQALAAAVAANCGPPNARNKDGIQWAAIRRRAMAGEYGASLQRRVSPKASSSKALAKRWKRLRR